MAGVPTLQEVLRRAFDSRAGDIHTAILGRVETYDAAKQVADISPLVKRALFTADDDLVHESLPVIPNVPVLFPRNLAGTYAITWPITSGDIVQLVFQMYAIGQWRRTGEVSEPGDLRLHHLGSAVAIPGLGPNANPIDPAQAGASALVLEGVEIRLCKDATDYVALASKVATELSAIQTAIAGILFTPGTGGGSLANPGYSPGTVAASKVKAK